MQQAYFSDDEADFINKTVVPVHFAGPVTVLFDGKTEPEQIPLVQVDASNRPDVADLARVARIEGIQRKGQPPYRYMTGKGNAAMIVTLVITDPVDCTFTAILKWPEHRDFFQLAMEREFFYLTVGKLEDALHNSIALTISRNELSEVIQRWQGEG
jgi:hypothetical protein